MKKVTGIQLFLLGFLVFIFSCTKIDTTTLGSDLLPEIDNIRTFADTIEVTVSNPILPDSSSKVLFGSEHAVGRIENDPLFGSTVAESYLQFKPGIYPYSFLGAKDTLLGVDSIVLTLAYAGYWGDKSRLSSFDIYEIDQDNVALWDSVNSIKNTGFRPIVTSQPLVSNVAFDTAKNQIRIKLADNTLNAGFMNILFNRDTLDIGTNNAFRSDEKFRQFYKGLAIKPSASPSNSLIYFSPLDAGTGMNVYFRKKSGTTDTVSRALQVQVPATGIKMSSYANYIKRNYAGSEFDNGTDPNSLYIQTQPGAYLNVDLAKVKQLSNRVVHRAYLHIEQVPHNTNTDTVFSVPRFMYYDLKDSIGENRWKPIYNDYNPQGGYNPDVASYYLPQSGVEGMNLSYMGSRPAKKMDAFGNTIHFYDLNITRYVQRLISHQIFNYNLRVFPASDFNYPQFPISETAPVALNFPNSVAYGRIKVGGPSHPEHKMKVVVIWSEIK